MEDAVAAGRLGQSAMSDALAALHASGRAYRAIGAVTDDTVDAMVGAAEMALYVRDNDWVTAGLSDLPTPDTVHRGALRSVTATQEAVVELWEHAVAVRTASGDEYELAGDVPNEHDWMEIRTNDGLVSVDLETGVRARSVTPSSRPLSAADLVVIWAACVAPAALAHDHDPRTPTVVPFEAVALVAGELTITAISGSQLLHTAGEMRPAVEWIVSPRGVHLVAAGTLIEPPVPPPPSPLRLVWIDGGSRFEVAIR